MDTLVDLMTILSTLICKMFTCVSKFIKEKNHLQKIYISTYLKISTIQSFYDKLQKNVDSNSKYSFGYMKNQSKLRLCQKNYELRSKLFRSKLFEQVSNRRSKRERERDKSKLYIAKF